MNRKTEVMWGLIFVGMGLLWMVLERVAGLHGPRIEYHANLSFLFAFPAVAVYVFALRSKRDRDLGGTMTWREGFVSGLIITAVVAVLAPVTTWITHTLITPDFFANAIEAGVALGETTRAEAEAYFNLGSYIRMGVIWAVGMGAVTSAVVAFFVRSKPVPE